uniref:Uncharacterized protein n=1 Tax=Anguilla anguilla TaxID=7936 RepID=A0A0E9PHT7_ANGAN
MKLVLACMQFDWKKKMAVTALFFSGGGGGC